MAKYYAVKNGKVPGIYMTWPECESQVKGFSGAIYKSFSSLSDAEEFIGMKTNNNCNDANTIHVYVDGSYNSDTNEYGYACYINFGDNQQLICGRGICEENGRNVEGEVSASITAIRYLQFEERPIIIHYDYEGIKKWADGEWKANKYYTKNYAEFVKSIRNLGINVKFEYVAGHSNNEYNELVDKLAKYSCGVILNASQINSLSQYESLLGYPDFTKLPNLDNPWSDRFTI